MRGGRGNGERADESGRMQSLRWGFARGFDARVEQRTRHVQAREAAAGKSSSRLNSLNSKKVKPKYSYLGLARVGRRWCRRCRTTQPIGRHR